MRHLAPGITSDHAVGFGRACVAGTGIPAAVIAERHAAKDSVGELAADYGLTVEQVNAALRYIAERQRCGRAGLE